MPTGARAMSRAMAPLRGSATLGRSGFIVELFGPAACGKTTFSRSLERALEGGGVQVRVVASSRPREEFPRKARATIAVTAPLSRAFKLFSALGGLAPVGLNDALGRQIIETLPPKGWIRQLRVRRYLRNLCRSWDAASTSKDVAIFDQGFMNSLVSLALSSDLVDRNSLARALSIIPAPDLLIRVDTPREVLKARLEKRLRHLGTIERHFERDIETALRQVELSSCLDDLLAERGRHSLHVSWSDRDDLEKTVGAVAGEILSRRKCSSI